jgi:hypothetical protein
MLPICATGAWDMFYVHIDLLHVSDDCELQEQSHLHCFGAEHDSDRRGIKLRTLRYDRDDYGR